MTDAIAVCEIFGLLATYRFSVLFEARVEL